MNPRSTDCEADALTTTLFAYKEKQYPNMGRDRQTRQKKLKQTDEDSRPEIDNL